MRRVARLLRPVVLAGLCAAVLATAAAAQDLASFEKRITVKKLPNGLTLVVCERHEAPVFSFFTYVDVGSVQEPVDQTGLAHMMEHMAFKGTDTIGTTNYAAEKVALAKVEQTYAAYNIERHKTIGQDKAKLAQLEKAWHDAVAAADKYVIHNQFGELIERNGGEGLNASTTEDSTEYYYSFPVNRLEFWAYLESQRFLHPVMREFYKERDVVMEERRMRTDSNPIGRLFEQLQTTAFQAHPYHRPTVGWMSDLQSISATQASQFFDKYYIPANMTIAVVGDVKPAQVIAVVTKYFGPIPGKPKPPDFSTIEPPQTSEREVILRERTQPIYFEAYHRPAFNDPDDAVYDTISDVMSDGRTSRLYRSLVRDKKIAVQAAGFSGLPGQKYPHLFAFAAVPTPGHTPKEMADAIHAEIDKLKSEDVTDDELKMVKTRAKAGLIRSLGDNEGLAQDLAATQARYGDWRELFRQVDRIDKVTKADIRRVANKIFVPTNRTVAYIDNAQQAKSTPAAGQAPPAQEQQQQQQPQPKGVQQ